MAELEECIASAQAIENHAMHAKTRFSPFMVSKSLRRERVCCAWRTKDKSRANFATLKMARIHSLSSPLSFVVFNLILYPLRRDHAQPQLSLKRDSMWFYQSTLGFVTKAERFSNNEKNEDRLLAATYHVGGNRPPDEVVVTTARKAISYSFILPGTSSFLPVSAFGPVGGPCTSSVQGRQW